MAIKIGKMAEEIMTQLNLHGVRVGIEVEKICADVADYAVERLQDYSPVLTGDYAASWTHSVVKTKDKKYIRIIYVEAPEHGLAHLLENGHNNYWDGGYTPGIEHIRPVEKDAVNRLRNEIMKRL